MSCVTQSRRRWVTPAQHVLLDRYICMYQDSVKTAQLQAFWDFFFVVWFTQFPSVNDFEMKLVSFSLKVIVITYIFIFRTSGAGSYGGVGDFMR
jgi:hypothetical protein